MNVVFFHVRVETIILSGCTVKVVSDRDNVVFRARNRSRELAMVVYSRTRCDIFN